MFSHNRDSPRCEKLDVSDVQSGVVGLVDGFGDVGWTDAVVNSVTLRIRIGR